MASMPAPRAAASTCTRAKCQKSPGYVADRVEVAVDPGVQRGRQVAGAEDDGLEPIARPGDLGRVGQALGLLDEHLEADPPAEAELGLELGEQHVDPPHVAGRAGLRHDEHVERLAGAGDDLDDVAVAPRRVEAVDPHGPHRAAPVEARSARRRRSPGPTPWPAARRRPRGRGTRGRRRSRPPSRTCARCWPAWPAPIVGLGVRARLPPWWCRSVQMTLGAHRQRRRAARARCRAARRRRPRCRRRARGRGGRCGPASR